MDPPYVANEGKFVAVVDSNEAEVALAAMRAYPQGVDAERIGEIRSELPGIVVLLTTLGGTRTSSTCWWATRSPASADTPPPPCSQGGGLSHRRCRGS